MLTTLTNSCEARVTKLQNMREFVLQKKGLINVIFNLFRSNTYFLDLVMMDSIESVHVAIFAESV